MKHKEFLKTQYPIVASPMNRVSDLKLAVACQKAGIVPSLSLYSYLSKETNILDLEHLDRDLKSYQDQTGSNNILVSAGNIDLIKDGIKNILFSNTITFIEIIHHDLINIPVEHRRTTNQLILKNIKESYSRENIKIMPKMLKKVDFNCNLADGVMFKGPDGAGRGDTSIDPDKEVLSIQSSYPNLHIIFSGGIGTKEDVSRYINLGCTGVGIGTLLTVADECLISRETKEKLIESKSSELTRLNQGAEQQALLLGDLVQGDDYNHSKSLEQGILDSTKGLLFVGKGVDKLQKIRPVKDIIEELVDGLDL